MGDVKVTLTGAEAKLGTSPLSTITTGSDPATGQHRTSVSDEKANSTAVTDEDHQFSLNVQNRGGVGEPNEARVVHTFVTHLRESGHDAASVHRPKPNKLEKDHGDGGVDGEVCIDGQNKVLQIVTCPINESLWSEPGCEGSTIQGDSVDAVDWLREAVEKKCLAPRAIKELHLLIDCRFASPLSAKSVIKEYLRRFGDPCKEYGFEAVWIVGPTAAHCASLGDETKS